MEVWLIVDGSQLGPFSDYEIRSQLRSGELRPDTPAWFQGQDGWHPLREIEVLKELLPEDASIDGIPFDREVLAGGLFANRPPPLPQQAMLGRRFWARWFDLQWYMTFFWAALALSGADVYGALKNLWLDMALLIPWFLIEAVLLHRFGTTPGKALLGLQVRNADGSALMLGAALRRCLRVLISGIGLGWGLLSLLCQGMSWFFARRTGRTMWDIIGEHRLVEVSELTALRVLVFVFGFFAALMLRAVVLYPAFERLAAELHPEWFPIR